MEIQQFLLLGVMMVSLNIYFNKGKIHANVNQKICRLEIVFDRLWYPPSLLLLAAIGAKLIGPHGGLQFDEQAIDHESRYVEWNDPVEKLVILQSP